MELLTLRNSDTGQVLGILGIFSKQGLLEQSAKEHNEQAIKSCRFIHDNNKIKHLSWDDEENGERIARAFQGNGIVFHAMPMVLDGNSMDNNSQLEITPEQIFNLFPALAEMKNELEALGCPVEINGQEDTDLTSIFINIGGNHPVLDTVIEQLKKNGFTTPER